MFQKLLKGLGKIDMETKVLLSKLIIRASKSDDANGWLKERLQWIVDRDDRDGGCQYPQADYGRFSKR